MTTVKSSWLFLAQNVRASAHESTMTSTKTTTTAKSEVCLTKGKQTSCPLFSQEGFEEPKVQRKGLLLSLLNVEHVSRLKNASSAAHAYYYRVYVVFANCNVYIY